MAVYFACNALSGSGWKPVYYSLDRVLQGINIIQGEEKSL